jgi:hypothetical protein
MLKIDLLIYFSEYEQNIKFKKKKTYQETKKFTQRNINNSEKSPLYFDNDISFLYERNYSKFLSGKLFKQSYCDLKIIDNKLSLNFNLSDSEVSIGAFSQKNGCLILTQISKKGFFFYTKNFFETKFISSFHDPTFRTSIYELNFPLTEKKSFSIYNYKNDVNYFRSKVNLGIIERLCNLKIDDVNYCELFFKKKKCYRNQNLSVFKCRKIYKIRRIRIFVFKMAPNFFQKKIKEKNFKWLAFQKIFLKCTINSRFLLGLDFFLSSNIIFSRTNYLFDVHKGLFNWIFQLKKENCCQIKNIYPISRFLSIKTKVNSQVWFIFGDSKIRDELLHKTTITKRFLGFSLLNNDTHWNCIFSRSELSVDFLLQPLSCGLNSRNKWNYSSNLVLFFVLSHQSNHFSAKNFKTKFSFKKPNFQMFVQKCWQNLIFDVRKFLKKIKTKKLNTTFLSDICQNNKMSFFLKLKNLW